MRYLFLLSAAGLMACAPANSSSSAEDLDLKAQEVRVVGSDQDSCALLVQGVDADSSSFKEVVQSHLTTNRDVTILATSDAAYQCVTAAQDQLNDWGFAAAIDDGSWSAMASVKAGVFTLVEGEVDHPEATPFDNESDAKADVEMALERAVLSDNKLIIVMGANWCHDSRALAGWFETPRFARLLSKDYEVVFVDVGYKDRNIDIAQSYGIEKIKGTPTVLVVSPEAQLLNPKSAPTWRNAASRDEDAIFDYFAVFEPDK